MLRRECKIVFVLTFVTDHSSEAVLAALLPADLDATPAAVTIVATPSQPPSPPPSSPLLCDAPSMTPAAAAGNGDAVGCDALLELDVPPRRRATCHRPPCSGPRTLLYDAHADDTDGWRRCGDA